MTLVLDPVRTVGGWRVGVLCRVTFHAHVSTRGAVAMGDKEPVAILLEGPEGMRAFAPDGTPIDPAALEMLQRGVIARFRSGI